MALFVIFIGFLIGMTGCYLLVMTIRFSCITWTRKKNIILSVIIIIAGVAIISATAGYKIATIIQ